MSEMDAATHREPWNKGKLVGQKAPLKPKEIWAIRTRLQIQGRVRELALFDLGIDSKLRGCDLVRVRLHDVCQGATLVSRATVLQQKTHRPVQFEITATTREAVDAWIKAAHFARASCISITYSFPTRTRLRSTINLSKAIRLGRRAEGAATAPPRSNLG